MKILDLSDWNVVVNYDSIKANYQGVIVKATQGNLFKCKSFDEKVTKLKSLGVKVGAYHYLDGNGSPEQQAEHFYNVIKKYDFDIIPVLDVEENPSVFDGNPSLHTTAFVNKFKALTGQDMVIYTYWFYCRDNFDLATKKKYKWWIANYGVKSLLPIDGCDIIAWQYTKSEIVGGIVKPVDCSILYNDKFFKKSYTVTQPIKPKQYDLHIKDYAENGTATVIVDKLNIRDNTNIQSNNIVGSYSRGEKFNYNHVFITDKHVWVKYTARSGRVRYVAVKDRITGERFAECK